MKKGSIVFLQIIIALIAVATVTFLIWEPQVEGVNVNATNFEIYLKDPFVIYAYIASLTFFTVLYQTFKLLSRARKNMIFSQSSIKSLQIIKYSALLMIPFVIGGAIFILLSPSDDRPPVIGIGALISLAAIVVAVVASMFEKILKNVVDMKSENDLTV